MVRPHRKARLHLVVFEAGLGGMSPYAARRLRKMGRDAKSCGADATDYTTSPTARSFVPFYAQRLSTACVLTERCARHLEIAQVCGGPRAPTARRRWPARK